MSKWDPKAAEKQGQGQGQGQLANLLQAAMQSAGPQAQGAMGPMGPMAVSVEEKEAPVFAADVERRRLVGFNNKEPMLGGGGGGRGTSYVILGEHNTWDEGKAPVVLTINGQGRGRVLRESEKYFSRGWSLMDGAHDGYVTLEDGSFVPVTISVSSVF